MNTYRAGIDIGSTTVKLVILDDAGQLLLDDSPHSRRLHNPPAARQFRPGSCSQCRA